MTLFIRTASILLLLILLTACTATTESCPVTEPEWLLPPDDPAVLNPPTHGNYFVNEDRSIWAAAEWADAAYAKLSEMKDGVKVGWFRPEGTELVVTGRRLDEEAPSLESEFPCCYPTRFQASGLYFPTEGCWEVTAKATDRSLTFVVWIEP